MIKKTTLLLGAVASMFLSVQTRAATSGSDGATCVPATQFDAPWLNFGTQGVGNIDSAQSHSLSCGLARLSSSSPRTLFIDYHDASPDNRISCFVAVNGFTGTPVWSQTQNSDIAGEGRGTLQFSLPSSAVGYVIAYCTLPPKFSSLRGNSRIAGYNLQ